MQPNIPAQFTTCIPTKELKKALNPFFPSGAYRNMGYKAVISCPECTAKAIFNNIDGFFHIDLNESNFTHLPTCKLFYPHDQIPYKRSLLESRLIAHYGSSPVISPTENDIIQFLTANDSPFRDSLLSISKRQLKNLASNMKQKLFKCVPHRENEGIPICILENAVKDSPLIISTKFKQAKVASEVLILNKRFSSIVSTFPSPLLCDSTFTCDGHTLTTIVAINSENLIHILGTVIDHRERWFPYFILFEQIALQNSTLTFTIVADMARCIDLALQNIIAKYPNFKYLRKYCAYHAWVRWNNGKLCGIVMRWEFFKMIRSQDDWNYVIGRLEERAHKAAIALSERSSNDHDEEEWDEEEDNWTAEEEDPVEDIDQTKEPRISADEEKSLELPEPPSYTLADNLRMWKKQAKNTTNVIAFLDSKKAFLLPEGAVRRSQYASSRLEGVHSVMKGHSTKIEDMLAALARLAKDQEDQLLSIVQSYPIGEVASNYFTHAIVPRICQRLESTNGAQFGEDYIKDNGYPEHPELLGEDLTKQSDPSFVPEVWSALANRRLLESDQLDLETTVILRKALSDKVHK